MVAPGVGPALFLSNEKRMPGAVWRGADQLVPGFGAIMRYVYNRRRIIGVHPQNLPGFQSHQAFARF